MLAATASKIIAKPIEQQHKSLLDKWMSVQIHVEHAFKSAPPNTRGPCHDQTGCWVGHTASCGYRRFGYHSASQDPHLRSGFWSTCDCFVCSASRWTAIVNRESADLKPDIRIRGKTSPSCIVMEDGLWTVLILYHENVPDVPKEAFTDIRTTDRMGDFGYVSTVRWPPKTLITVSP